MTYLEDSAQYRNDEFRQRAEMCTREQAYIYAADGRADIAALAAAVIAGNMVDIDAVIAAVVTAPGNEGLEEDGALLASVQAVWPTVADAIYPIGE